MAKTRKEQAELTKQKILDAAQKLVAEEGVHALSSLKIVSKAGISKGSFFHHFPQIEDLYLCMLDDLALSMEESASPRKFATFKEFIDTCARYTLSLLEESPEKMSSMFYFLSQCRQKPDYRVKLKIYLERVFAQWANDMEHFFPEGISLETKEKAVRILDMYFCGLSVHSLVMREPDYYLEITEDFFQILYNLITEDSL